MTAETLRFLAYSDIHHDRLAARCITLKDTLEIERQVHTRVIEGGFDFSVFTGDRFLKREPEDEVKVKADRVLLEMLEARGSIPHFHLVGNHDWTKNNREWHTSESLKKKLVVMDTAQTHKVERQPAYCIHPLPADVPFDRGNYVPTEVGFNLFLFHGIVRGSFMADDSDMTFSEGIEASQIDLVSWDFVLAGDIHVPQHIPFKNTKGGYVGAVLQRTRADADKQRGWLEVTASKTAQGWHVETEFKPTRNFFHREVHEVGPESSFSGLPIEEEAVDDVAVEVKLIGSRADVDRVADDPKWQNYTHILNARSLEIIREYQVEQNEAVVDLSTSTGVMDDLKLYLGSEFVNIGNMDQDKLFEILQRVQQEG
jgi:DNA repair exonuclease SbcCD nuclease subunit